MEPQHIPDNEKNNWGVIDCFDGKLLEDYVHGFWHKSYAIGMHTHDFYELNIVCAGEGWHYIEDRRCVAQAGCVFVIPPGIRHGYWQRTSLDVYHVLILNDFFVRYTDELHQLPGYASLFEIEPYLRSRVDVDLFLRLDDDELRTLRGMLEEMEALSRDAYAGAPILRSIEALRLIGTLARYSTSRLSPASGSPCSPEPLRIMEYVRAHLDQPLSLESLARKYHLSRSTLARTFRAVARQSVGEYVTRCRLEESARLLTGSTRSMAEIAQRCGYCDGSHFARQFARCMGISPLQYRKRGAAGENPPIALDESRGK